MTKISIVIPIYNVEKYLEQCVRSVMNQTYKNLEIICVNDGSTDNSYTLLEKLAQIDSRIKLIDKPNSGYGHTMNVGLSHATGDYLGIVESDDYISESMFEEMLNLAEKYSLDMLKTNFYEVYNERPNFFENMKGIPYDEILGDQDIAKMLYKAPSIWSGLYKRAYLLNNKIKFNETPGASFQDTSFYYKTLLSGPRLMLSKNAYLYYRRDNTGSSMHSENKMFCIIDEFKEIRSYLLGRESSGDILKSELDYKEYLTYRNQIRELPIPFKFTFILKISEMYKFFEDSYDLNMKLFSEKEIEEISILMKDPLGCLKLYIEYDNEKVRINNSSMFCMNWKLLVDGTVNLIKQKKEVYIYGAGKIASKVISDIKKINSHIDIHVCVSKLEKPQQKLENYEVIDFNHITDKEKKLFLVATSDHYQFEIMKTLKNCGCEQVISFNNELRESIRKYFSLVEVNN